MKVAALILAAGESRRFEGIKQLADIQGKTLLNHVINAYLGAGCSPIYVALGANEEYIARTLPKGVKTISVKDWNNGMGHSLATAVTWIDENNRLGCGDKLMIGLADQVNICVGDITLLIRKSQEFPSKIIAANYNQLQAVPAVFGADDFKSLSKLQGDVGARAYIKNNKNKVIAVDLPSAAFDIDTKNDLQNWHKNQHNEKTNKD